MSAVAVHGLRVVRSGRVLVDGIAFEARFGAVTAVLGPNGAGKSSLLKAMAGVVPHEGQLLVDGVDARTLDGAARARLVAYVPQHSELRAPLTVFDVVAQGRYAHHAGRFGATSEDRAAAARALARTGAASLQERVFTTLSQGERQRVLIARALATEARVLLLDEPTAALDIGHALRVHGMLRELAREGRAIVAVLHALQDAFDWTDEALLLDKGRQVLWGPTPDVIRNPEVEAIYGVRLVPGAAFGFEAIEAVEAVEPTAPPRCLP